MKTDLDLTVDIRRRCLESFGYVIKMHKSRWLEDVENVLREQKGKC
jgi:hypothetical protein